MRTVQARAQTLRSVVESAIIGKLALNRQQVESLVTAMLDNPNALDTTRADAFLMAAAQASTAPVCPINLAELALRIGRPDIAAKHVEEAHDLDRKGIDSEDIAQLRERLADAQTTR